MKKISEQKRFNNPLHPLVYLACPKCDSLRTTSSDIPIYKDDEQADTVIAFKHSMGCLDCGYSWEVTVSGCK